MDTSKYIFRTVAFSKQGDQVRLVDIFAPNESTPPLDPWLAIVVQLADGRHTIDQLLVYLAAHYRVAPPPDLAGTIESVIQRLVESKVVLLSDNLVELPYYLTLPVERLDIEKAKRLITEGGD